MGQQEMAALVGCSKVSIQSIELLRLKLSPNLAGRIVHQTGVDFGWLMGGDPKAPMLNRGKGVYRQQDYFFVQTVLGQSFKGDRSVAERVEVFCGRIKAILDEAEKTGNLDLLDWRIAAALTKIENQGAAGDRGRK